MIKQMDVAGMLPNAYYFCIRMLLLKIASHFASTHLLQPFNVGPFQYYYSNAVDNTICHDVHGIYKAS